VLTALVVLTLSTTLALVGAPGHAASPADGSFSLEITADVVIKSDDTYSIKMVVTDSTGLDIFNKETCKAETFGGADVGKVDTKADFKEEGDKAICTVEGSGPIKDSDGQIKHEGKEYVVKLGNEESSSSASQLDVTQTTGLGHVVTDLGAAVRAVSDDIAAAGFDITYQCGGDASPTRSQASTLSRVAREMGANVVRHAEPNAPVTMTLRLGPEAIRLVSTNRIRMTPGDLPHSGSGVLGMRERLTAIGGELTTLADDGAWIVTATVPVASTRAPLPGSES